MDLLLGPDDSCPATFDAFWNSLQASRCLADVAMGRMLTCECMNLNRTSLSLLGMLGQEGLMERPIMPRHEEWNTLIGIS
jgi:hypothetical protein